MSVRLCAWLLSVLVLVACTLPTAPPSGGVAVVTATPAPTTTIAEQEATSVPPTSGVPATLAPFPSAIPNPVPTSAPAATATPAALLPLVDDPLLLAASTPVVRDQAALAQAFTGVALPADVSTQPVRTVGELATFWVADPVDSSNYTVTAQLRYAGPIVLMYIDTELTVDQAAIERSARTFEQNIYPRNRAIFGSERRPGIDGDSRLTVLNTRLRGAAGYFSPSDDVPASVNRFSNQRNMFVMGLNAVPIGTTSYAATLAHEFQHMIHQQVQPRSPIWFNEGMSKLAEDLNGYRSDGTPLAYLRDTNLQLTGWSALGGALPHYGAAQLFLRYIQAQYTGEAGLAQLLTNNAGNQPAAFVAVAQQKRADIASFADLVADWAVANLLNDASIADGRYAYPTPRRVQPTRLQRGTAGGTTAQFGVSYLQLPSGGTTVSFAGATEVGLTGVQPFSGQYAWWSNRGDESASTLTRSFDLRNVRSATLEFAAWYEIERDYDYAFVAVSTDGGQRWQTLKGSSTTTSDPQGHNYGNGFTGVSGAPGADAGGTTRGSWVNEQVDLTPFAGQQIQLRFWMVTDAALSYPGMLIDDIRIAAINYRDDVEVGAGGWQATGFARTTGNLPQTWALRLVRQAGNRTQVEPVVVGDDGRAQVTLARGESGVLIIIPTTPITSEAADYAYTIE